MKSRTALIVGSTGLIGGHCLRLLLESGLYERVISLTRRPSGLTHAGLKEVLIDFDRLESHVKEFRADDVFCCLGTTIKKAVTRENFVRVDHDYPLIAANTAYSRGARRFFVVSAMGASSSSRIFYNRVKGDLERDLKKIGFDSLHIFRPSLLVGERSESRPGEKIAAVIMRALDPFFFGPLKNYRSISAEKVARAMIKHAAPSATGVFVHKSGQMQDC